MKYIVRSVKYLIKLVVLLALLFLIMTWSGTSALSGDGWQSFFASYFATWKGWLFTAAMAVWCAFYPRVEFVTRSVGGDLHANKPAIIKALNAGHMILTEETDRKMVFRTESLVRKIWWMGDDAVTITHAGNDLLNIEGPRRFVMEAQYRIPAYIEREL